jgi:uncharacterized membrane protein
MAYHEDAYKTLPVDTTPAITLLRGMGYTPNTANPAGTYGLAVAVLGVVIIIAGLAMSRRKKS